MRIFKKHVLLRIVNSYIIDSPQPANMSYLWNFGSLLGTCLVLQILTGIFLAMHYQPNVDFAFASVEHYTKNLTQLITDLYFNFNIIDYLNNLISTNFFLF